VLAGGGFRGGRVVGASNETGERVVERPVHPRQLIASIYEQLGIDLEARMDNPRGLDVKALPPAKDETGKGRLREIMG
jgi:hypothetical protein